MLVWRAAHFEALGVMCGAWCKLTSGVFLHTLAHKSVGVVHEKVCMGGKFGVQQDCGLL